MVARGEARLAVSRLAPSTNAAVPKLRQVGVWASMPGYGHQGFHPVEEGSSPPVGSWNVARLVLRPCRRIFPKPAPLRAILGSHRNAPQFADWKGSAMPSHPDEVRIEADPGDYPLLGPPVEVRHVQRVGSNQVPAG